MSRNTVAKVAAAAKRLSLPPSVWETLSEAELHQQIFPTSAATSVPIIPDYKYIHRELLRSGIMLKLLWEEYVDNCILNVEAILFLFPSEADSLWI